MPGTYFNEVGLDLASKLDLLLFGQESGLLFVALENIKQTVGIYEQRLSCH